MTTRHPVDRTTVALEAGIILGPAVAALIAYLVGWRGDEAVWALILGLWSGLVVAGLISIPRELHHHH